MATNNNGAVPKNWLAAFVLSLLVGVLGVDRFYLGKIGTGIVKLLTFGGFGIWALIDFILIATKRMGGVTWTNDGKDAQKKAWIIFAAVVILSFVGGVTGITGTSSNSTANKVNTSNTAAVPAETGTTKDTIAPSPTTPTPATAPTPTPAPAAAQPSVPAEYKSALSKATSYSNMQHMSKSGLYDQLTSEYGEQFSAAAAQYAIDNVKADWNANALAKAKSYQSQQSMSPAAIHDQLTSEYGEKFTASEADYAIAHLND